MAVITGRRIRDLRNTRTNIYVIVLAGSGTGKEAARTLNKDLLRRRLDSPSRHGGDRLTSYQGIISALELYPLGSFNTTSSKQPSPVPSTAATTCT